MIKLRKNRFLVVIIICLILNIVKSGCMDIVSTYCTQTERESLFPTPRTIAPEPTNASLELQTTSDYGPLSLDLCPDSRFLKLSWIISRAEDYDTTLCFKLSTALNGNIMDTVCHKLRMHPSNYSVAMNCWFPVEFINNDQVITAWTIPANGAIPKFYGRLYTDLRSPCKDICEVVAMELDPQINCHEKVSVVYDRTIVVKNLSFDVIGQSGCRNGIVSLQQFEDHLEYRLNCSFAGTGYIKVLYTTHGKYCLKYQMVRVYCSKTQDDLHSFGTFLAFGLICIAVITSVFFAVVMTAQWLHDRNHTKHGKHHHNLHHRRYSDLLQHRFIDQGSRPSGTRKEECFQLRPFPPQPSGSRHTSPLISADVSIRKDATPRQRSASTSSDKMPEEENERRRLLLVPIRRSITMALLEDTDPFYKKKILFLPIPFDHFTNDVVKILKSVFMDEGGIISECCFDRKVYQKYMETDRYKWIEHVFSDHDKILIFLCFTSLSLEPPAKRESVAEVVLENLLFTKVKSHRFCKVILLHLTDSPDNIQSHDIGDHLHISDPNSYEDFIRSVLDSCGRNPEEHPEFINRMTNCKASKHFQKFIGMKHTS